MKVLRAVQRFKNLKGRRAIDRLANTVEEAAEAELLWVKSAQKELSDIKILTKQFNLFKDEKGLWRCSGQLANTDLQYAVKYPILLRRSHPLTSLIVKQAHERVFHNEVKETLAETRSKYWIPSGRSFTRNIIHKCVTCRKFEGPPFKAPLPPPLPECRMKEAPAFSYTGVDFAGPFMVCVSQCSQSTKFGWRYSPVTSPELFIWMLFQTSPPLPLSDARKDLSLGEACRNASFLTMERPSRQHPNI